MWEKREDSYLAARLVFFHLNSAYIFLGTFHLLNTKAEFYINNIIKCCILDIFLVITETALYSGLQE